MSAPPIWLFYVYDQYRDVGYRLFREEGLGVRRTTLHCNGQLLFETSKAGRLSTTQGIYLSGRLDKPVSQRSSCSRWRNDVTISGIPFGKLLLPMINRVKLGQLESLDTDMKQTKEVND